MSSDNGFISNTQRKPLSAFSTILIFVVLSLIGLALIPFLSIHLNPKQHLPQLSVSYQWRNASPKTIEQEVTAPLESALMAVGGLIDISSVSAGGSGHIHLSFSEFTNFDFARFEVASIIRRLHPQLPQHVTMPQISLPNNSQQNEHLITYTLNGNDNSYQLMKYAEKHIKNKLSAIKGVQTVDIYGATPYEWVVSYSAKQIKQLSISTQNIITALKNHQRQTGIGISENQNEKSIVLKFSKYHTFDGSKIIVAKRNNRLIYLTDIAKIERRQQAPNSYYRINGLNALNIVIAAANKSNHIRVANNIKKTIQKISLQLPKTYSIQLTYDSTEFIKSELATIIWRTTLVLVILLLFVFLISRSLKYLLHISITVFVVLFISFLCYYFLGLNIHLYSLAGIAISFGLIIDNSIVLLDHIRNRQNTRIFVAILSSTLTTIGALSVVFFLPETQKFKLIDFVLVICVNLSVSLLVALFFIPALFNKMPLKKAIYFQRTIHIRKLAKTASLYAIFIRFMNRYRKTAVVSMLLIFGLPVFLLPDKIGTKKNQVKPENEIQWFHQLYNSTLGNDWYLQNLKPHINKWLGGTLRLFLQETYPRATMRTPQRTKVFVKAQMPNETSIEQMNDLMLKIENYLAQFSLVEQYQTKINSAQSASIVVFFTKEAGYSTFPYFIENKLKEKAIFYGGADWQVYGVGRGFNNSLKERTGAYKIVLNGYNYEKLLDYAEKSKQRLLKNPRVNEVHFMSRYNWYRNLIYQYIISPDYKVLTENNLSVFELNSTLKKFATNKQAGLTLFINNNYETVRLQPSETKSFDLWKLMNNPLQTDTTKLKLNNLAAVKKQTTASEIYKENQQYQLIVEYDFIGTETLGQKIYEHEINQLKIELPMGYTAKKLSFGTWQKEGKYQYLLIFLVVAIIYFITAVLFESLWQPLAVIAILPISFAGVFITFYMFNINFDQGGYASFILISGITVNASIYLLNDFNQYCRNQHTNQSVRFYIKAFFQKIIPVMLTIISTIFGFVPFLIAGRSEIFWFPLAAGTIGGLLFSVIALLFYLPVFALTKVHPNPKETKSFWSS